jgi:hypothetical protein
MVVATVELRGSAVTGVEAIPHHLQMGLPRTVRLGRIRRKAHPCVLKLDKYFTPTTPPPQTNYRAKAAYSIGRMYLNDQYGDCVIAGKAHALGVWSANDTDSGGLILATDQEVLDQYHGICGPGDNGCVITDVLDVMRSKGFVAGGKTYKIDGYVSCDWTNKLLVQTAQYIFGASSIGINLPEAWTQNSVWDVTSTRIVGGHDVTPIDWDDNGVYVASWGRIYQITWAAFTSKKWIDEYYVILSPTWYNNDKMAPSGINAAALKADLAKLGSGIIPPIDPGPVPPVPPDPPVPPVPPIPPPAELFHKTFIRPVRKGQTIAFYAPVDIPTGSVLTCTAPRAAEGDGPLFGDQE